ncbi:MAG TPA: hypothetical protein VFI23_16160 [Rhizomicrobium sp.]|nr:hypothetical protein [Rhizomicrobium sp.]
MFESMKIKAALSQYRADILRVISAQSPTDPNHRFFRPTGVEEQRAQLLKDWDLVLSIVSHGPTRAQAEQKVVECVTTFVNARMALLRMLKDGGQHEHYMWETPLWAYWSLYLLARNPSRTQQITHEIADLMMRWATFLGLTQGQVEFFNKLTTSYDRLPN